jgi:hypothetical protein
MIPPHVVVDLCKLGELGEPESAEAVATLRRLAPWDDVNRQTWQTWDKVTDGLDTATLASLVRGLVLAEEALKWLGGSVSGVIWTYRALQKRDPDAAEAVADWGGDRTTNSWVPFRRRSEGELAARRAVAAAREANKKRIEKEQEGAKRRQIEHSQAAREHAAATVRDSHERAGFLQGLADRPLADRLQAMLADRDHPVSWFPETWATEAMLEAANLNPRLRAQLIERLAGWHKGPWRKLCEALVAARQNG